MNFILTVFFVFILLINPTFFAEGLHLKILSSVHISPNKISEVTGEELFKKGLLYYNSNQIKNAIDSWNQALQLFQKSLNTQGEMQVLGALSAGYIELGDHNQAIIYGDKLLKMAQTLKVDNLQAQAFGNLGIAHQKIGDYRKSIELNQKALEIFKKLRMRAAEGQLLSNLGNLYAIIGDYNKAITIYQEGLEIARSLKNKQQESTTLSNLGAVYTNEGDNSQALRLYQESLEIARSLNTPSLEISILINMGTTYYLLGDKNLGTNKLEEAQKLAQNLENPQLLGNVLSNLGLIYEDQNKFNKALEFHRKSLQIAINSKNPRLEALANNNLAHTLLLKGELTEAAQYLRTAIQKLDRVRSSLKDLEQVNIFDTQVHSYNLLQRILIADHQPEAALEASEQGRARAFAQRLYSNKSNNESLSLSTPSINKIRKIAKQQNATIVSYTITSDLQFKFRGKQRGQEEELFIWVVQPTGKVAFRRVDLKYLRKKQITLGQLTNASRCLMSSRRSCLDIEESIEEFTEGDYPGLKELYQLMISPIADLLPKNPDEYVIFIPQDSLFQVPIAALQSPNGEFLIEKHTILSAPSIQVLDFSNQQHQSQLNDPNRSAMVIGNPTMPKVAEKIGEIPTQLRSLPASEKEAQEIAKILFTKSKIGAEATKSYVLKNLEQARFVHFATHGLLDYTKGGLSSSEVPGVLALAPEGDDDGLLTTSEILNLKLKAKLVVLSACDTGRGKITGDGVIGLSRAWMSAGVPSVIVSLRPVYDLPSQTLMISFYKHFIRTSNVSRSLRQAMLETMKMDRTPVRWGTFVLLGEAEVKF